MNEQNLLWVDYIIAGLAFVVLYLYVAPKVRRKVHKNVKMILPKDLRSLVKADEDILIIDIRKKHEFNGVLGYIDNSINIPLQELPKKLAKENELQNLKSTTIIIVDYKNDSNAILAYSLLSKIGFYNVLILDNGITGWIKKGFATVKMIGDK